jgi:hypothetical protein
VSEFDRLLDIARDLTDGAMKWRRVSANGLPFSFQEATDATEYITDDVKPA